MTINKILTPLFKNRCCRTQYCFYTVKMTSLLVPPASVRGMTRLDRAAFTVSVEVPCLKLRDTNIHKIMPILKKYLLKVRRFKPVQNTNEGTTVYLNPLLIKNYEDFTENDRKQLPSQYEHFGKTNLTLNYENWRSDEILKSILPEGIETPTSYSLVGHIVHLNLRDVHLPYKNLIGQVYLDHIPVARTIVNKINTIDTTFRHFTMEILAGEKDTVTTVKENGFTYQFDFAQVYWNTRLSSEHANLITLMKRGDTLYDVFAGVGPFAIPAAHKRINVFANDLNPESYKWLQKNAATNKVQNNLKAFNMDGRDFLRSIVKTDILNRRRENASGSEHIVMNLPGMAVEFLDIFSDWFTQEEMEKICSRPPTIHLYCFVKFQKGEDVCKLGKMLVEEKIGCTLNSDYLVSLHNVRNVSPNKEMIRVSFLLTESILKGEEPATKKLRIENCSTVYVIDNVTENNGKEQGIPKEPEEQKCVQSSDSP